MRLVDTHTHIHGEEFPDVDEAIDRALAAGVSTILTLGVTYTDSLNAVALAERRTEVWAAAGAHPHDAGGATTADLDALEELAMHPRVAVIGEIGLDYYRDLSPRDAQRRVFQRQLDTAARCGKPVAVHAREAHEDVFPVLEAWSRGLGGVLPDGRPPGVLHYFSGDAELAQRYVALGYIISVHTSVTHPRAEVLRAVARAVPLDRMVLETDSPYGAPQRHRGRRNEPAYVAESVALIANERGMPVEAVASATSETALRFLGVSTLT